MFVTALVCWGILGSGAAAPADGIRSRLGVAVRGQREVCLSIAQHGLGIGTPVALVQPDEPPAVAMAVVVGVGRGCPGERRPGMVGYLLRLTRGTVERDAVLIAVLGGVVPSVYDGLVQADLQGGGHTDTFRSCTSTDGVHVTVWDGTSPQAQRLWHDYYYLGQDLEPTCSDRETAE